MRYVRIALMLLHGLLFLCILRQRFVENSA